MRRAHASCAFGVSGFKGWGLGFRVSGFRVYRACRVYRVPSAFKFLCGSGFTVLRKLSGLSGSWPVLGSGRI